MPAKKPEQPHTPRFEPSSNPKPLKRLSRAIQKKVVLEIENADETNCCWIWTGAFKQPKQQALRLYSNHASREAHGGGNRGRPSEGLAGYYTRERGLPMMHLSGTKSVISAARIIYAEVYDLPIDEVPHMRRCVNDRCVSPYHLNPTGKRMRYTRFAAEEVRAPAPGSAPGAPAPPIMSVDSILMTLIRKDVYTGHDGPAAGAEEAGLDPALVTPEIWKQYIELTGNRDE